eukprot:Lankesteria_metandrocarpae@DN4524_c0_g1_i1.p1
MRTVHNKLNIILPHNSVGWQTKQNILRDALCSDKCNPQTVTETLHKLQRASHGDQEAFPLSLDVVKLRAFWNAIEGSEQSKWFFSSTAKVIFLLALLSPEIFPQTCDCHGSNKDTPPASSSAPFRRDGDRYESAPPEQALVDTMEYYHHPAAALSNFTALFPTIYDEVHLTAVQCACLLACGFLMILPQQYWSNPECTSSNIVGDDNTHTASPAADYSSGGRGRGYRGAQRWFQRHGHHPQNLYRTAGVNFSPFWHVCVQRSPQQSEKLKCLITYFACIGEVLAELLSGRNEQLTVGSTDDSCIASSTCIPAAHHTPGGGHSGAPGGDVHWLFTKTVNFVSQLAMVTEAENVITLCSQELNRIVTYRRLQPRQVHTTDPEASLYPPSEHTVSTDSRSGLHIGHTNDGCTPFTIENISLCQMPLSPVELFGDGCRIEDSLDALQADFANKWIGGGVLDAGCVQEEIRFCLSPEMLLCRMLFVGPLGKLEASLMIGTRRYTRYRGYGRTFKCGSLFIDEKQEKWHGLQWALCKTHSSNRSTAVSYKIEDVIAKQCVDASSVSLSSENSQVNASLEHDATAAVSMRSRLRLSTFAVALDAAVYRGRTHWQFEPKNMLRDATKAIVATAFIEGVENTTLPSGRSTMPFATGNWGCGAFGGDRQLKAVLQWLACSLNSRPLHYYSFGEQDVSELELLAKKWVEELNVNVGVLWTALLALASTDKLRAGNVFNSLQLWFHKHKP